MPNKTKIISSFSILLLFLSQGCGGKCQDIACFTPPQNFLFELVDNSTNENLFTNGTFESSKVNITNLENGKIITFDFIDEDDRNLINISSIGWETEKVNASISISDNDIFNLVVDAERKSENCCEFTRYNEIEIVNTTYILDTENGIYTILVEI